MLLDLWHDTSDPRIKFNTKLLYNSRYPRLVISCIKPRIWFKIQPGLKWLTHAEFYLDHTFISCLVVCAALLIPGKMHISTGYAETIL